MTGAPLNIAKRASNNQQQKERPSSPGDSARHFRQQIFRGLAIGVINESIVLWFVIDEAAVAVLVSEAEKRWPPDAGRTSRRPAVSNFLCGLFLYGIGREVCDGR